MCSNTHIFLQIIRLGHARAPNPIRINTCTPRRRFSNLMQRNQIILVLDIKLLRRICHKDIRQIAFGLVPSNPLFNIRRATELSWFSKEAEIAWTEDTLSNGVSAADAVSAGGF